MIDNLYPYAYISRERANRLAQYGLRVVTEPVNEQITLAEARLHLRLDTYGSPPAHEDDPWLLATIPAVREWCEFYAGRAMAPQTLELTLGAFPLSDCYGVGNEIKLPMAPIAGVLSVDYLDSTGALVTIDPLAYAVDVSSEPGYVYPLIGASWPYPGNVVNAVRVRYNAGCTTPTDSPNDMPLPKSMKSAMLLMLGHLYENRENSTDLKLEELPLGAKALLDRLRLRLGFA